jgi:hypothetical protein
MLEEEEEELLSLEGWGGMRQKNCCYLLLVCLQP